MRTIEILIDRFNRKGFANVNGYYNGDQSYLESKYQIRQRTLNIEGQPIDVIEFLHWGTVTVRIEKKSKIIMDIYGQSYSDSQSIVDFLYQIGNKQEVRTSYRPSVDVFRVWINDNEIDNVMTHIQDYPECQESVTA